ncbi:MAG: hypothetical protein PHS14_04965 [Elusimicrobia bacterium]|nr:hypothetical protein [Elusimicrobiota bacterium]
MKTPISLVVALMSALGNPAAAAGLRTPFGEVIIRNLKIGQTYSMYKLVNLPLRVVNTGGEPTEIRIETVRSSALNEGYEPIPSLDWVRVDQGTFTVAANREAVTDLILTIPNDPKLLGRRFQADIWTHSVDHRAYLVGLKSRILIHIDSTPPSEEELKKKFVNESLANLDFTISPMNAEVFDVPVGREVDLRKEHKLVIKVVNPNDTALNFRVRSIPVGESMILAPVGYIEARDPLWLRPEKDILKIDGSSISSLGLRLSIPDEPGVRGRNLYFIVAFEVLEQKIPTRVYYRLMVHTAAK